MTQYHVSLNGQGYVLDLDRYQKRIREPFPSKQTEGSVDFGDLRGPEQLLVLSDWSGGEGVVSYDEATPSRYRSGSDIDIWSLPGAVRLGAELAAPLVDYGADESCCLAVFNGNLMIGLSNGQLYRYDGAAFTALVNTGAAVRSMDIFMNRLYYGCQGTGVVGSYTTGWVNAPTAFTVAGSTGVWTLRTHYRQAAQYLYVGSSGTGTNGVSRAYYWDGGALSAGQFDFEELFPLASAVLNGRLYFVASQAGGSPRLGLYSVDDSGSGGVWRQHVRLDGVFCWSAVAFDGALYLGCSPGGQVLRWDGAQLTRVLQLGTPLVPHTGDIRGMAVWNGALWVATVDAGGILLLRYDGRAWSRPATGVPGTASRALAAYNDQLYVGTQRTTVGAQGTVWRVASGVRTSGTVESGLISCGLPGVPKLLKSVTLVTSALASGQAVAVQYRLEDTGGWTTLGTLSTVGATTATYQFGASVTGRLIALRLVLTTSSAGNGSPVVHEVGLRYVPRPTLAREWELAVILEGTPELPLVTLDQAAEPLTGAQLSSALWTAAGVAGTVTLVDLDGASYAVYVQDVREEVGKISQRRGYQRLGLVKLVEAA
ncbi:MAG: hypothetical protein IT306_03040 [Chloroflexi bacterium]|nr:hypothetical protein [Chloroflexota bacterium]